ncbi:hypothetical protein BJ741DRAFT_581469 [Chytriomyces cf. hyalinus JEL632]|nr:hypothetical protein BJ741DRAFT_581469 [Chytriomyces cf. hyalinus JEL632]
MPPKAARRTSPCKITVADPKAATALPQSPDQVKKEKGDRFEKHHWMAEQVTFLLEEMVDQAKDSKKSTGSFKKPTWNTLASRFNRCFRCVIGHKQLKSKWCNVKKAPTVPAGVMLEYIEGMPAATVADPGQGGPVVSSCTQHKGELKISGMHEDVGNRQAMGAVTHRRSHTQVSGTSTKSYKHPRAIHGYLWSLDEKLQQAGLLTGTPSLGPTAPYPGLVKTQQSLGMFGGFPSRVPPPFVPTATDCRLAWDIVNRGLADYDLLAMLFQASQAKCQLSKGSTSSSLMALVGTQDAEGDSNDNDNDNDNDDNDNDKDDLHRDADSENAVPALTNQAMSKTPSKSPLSSTGLLSLAADAGSLNQKKLSAQPNIASISDQQKRSHTTPAKKPSAPTDPALLNALDQVVNHMDCMDHPIENEKGAYSSLLESAQLQAWVAEKVEDILSKCNVEFDSAMCEWLKEELTFKYNELFK